MNPEKRSAFSSGRNGESSPEKATSKQKTDKIAEEQRLYETQKRIWGKEYADKKRQERQQNEVKERVEPAEQKISKKKTEEKGRRRIEEEIRQKRKERKEEVEKGKERALEGFGKMMEKFPESRKLPEEGVVQEEAKEAEGAERAEGAEGEVTQEEAKEEIRFEPEEKEKMPWDVEALIRSNREFLEEYGLVPELKGETLENIDRYLQDDIFDVQLKMAKEWAKMGDNMAEIKKALGGKEEISDRELVAEVKRMGGFEQMMEEEGLSDRIDELKERWKQLNTLRETWKKGEAPAQVAGLTLYEFEEMRKVLEEEVEAKRTEVVGHWKKLTTGKLAPEVKENIQKEYQQLLEELKEKEQKLQTLQRTQQDILEVTAGRDLEREARTMIMGDLIKTGKRLETKSEIRRFAKEIMGWKVEGLSAREKITRKLKGEPTDVIRVTYETGETEEIPEADLKELIIDGYKENRQREEITKLIEKAAPNKAEAVKNAYEALKDALIKQAKEKELNKVASPEKIEKLKEVVGEGGVDVINGIENLNKGILETGFTGNIEGDYSRLRDIVDSSGLGEMPELEEISDEARKNYGEIVESKDRVGLIRWIVEALLEGIKTTE
ncbi:hypothetical protein J7J18_02845 [bacterium]|nr:hypothetical protein [bacterium]